MITLVVISILSYDYRILVLLFCIITPVFGVFYIKNRRDIQKTGLLLYKLDSQIARPVYDTIFGYTDITLSSSYKYFEDIYLTHIKNAQRSNMIMGLKSILSTKLVEGSIFLAIIIIVLYGTFFLKSPNEVISLITVLGLAAFRCLPSFSRIFSAIINIRAEQYLFDVIAKYDIETIIEEEYSIDFNDQIELNNISFTYPEKPTPTISNYSLIIKKGECIAIQGKSGAGKTTLLNILTGFLSPQTGAFKIDETELNKSNINSWRTLIGQVSQDIYLLDDSLKNNIALGVPEEEIDIERLNFAIEKSELTSFVSSLEKGIDTLVGEKGCRISGGQKQRVGIARALYRDVKFILLDEATSSIDTETEDAINETILELKKSGITILIISHKNELLKHCDRVEQL